MNDHISTLSRRTAFAAIAAGTLLSVSTAAELVHAVESDGAVVDVPLFSIYVALYGAGMVCLAAMLVFLRALHRAAGRPLPRTGRAAVRTALAGTVLHVLFTVQVIGSAVTTGKAPDVFALFGGGYLLLIVGALLLALGLRRAGLLGFAWALPLVAAIGAGLAIMAVADPYHDIGLFVFDAAWVGLGASLLLRVPAARPAREDGERPSTTKVKAASLAAIVAAGALLVACGDDNGKALSKRDYLKKVNAICVKYERKVDASANKIFAADRPPTQTEFGRFVDAVVAIAKQERSEFRELRAPEGDQKTIEKIVDAQDKGLERFKQAKTDRAVFKAIALEETEDPFKHADRLATSYGLDKCAG